MYSEITLDGIAYRLRLTFKHVKEAGGFEAIANSDNLIKLLNISLKASNDLPEDFDIEDCSVSDLMAGIAILTEELQGKKKKAKV